MYVVPTSLSSMITLDVAAVPGHARPSWCKSAEASPTEPSPVTEKELSLGMKAWTSV